MKNLEQFFDIIVVGAQRGRKATAPLHTPRAFFRSSWVVVWGTVLTFVCMLRYWM